jgi:two-component system response regulator RegA
MSEVASPPTILLVDDDEVFRVRLARAFRDRGFEVRQAANRRAAIASARADSPEHVVVDLRLPDASGLDVVRELHALDPGSRIVVLTSYGSIATALDAVRLGAAHYLTKPTDVDEILAAFARVDAPATPVADVPSDPLSLARVEWEHINRVLADCGGNISEAARRLGMHRRSLQRKLAKFPTRR